MDDYVYYTRTKYSMKDRQKGVKFYIKKTNLFFYYLRLTIFIVVDMLLTTATACDANTSSLVSTTK